MVLPSGQKVTLGLLATITLEVFPSASAIFFNIFCKSCSVMVFSIACNSASITSTVSKWCLFSFIFNRGKRKKVGWVGDGSHVVFGKKFRDEKGSMRLCVVVMQQLVLLSPKLGAKSSHIFTQSP
jgi:hypothetical protein